MDEIRSRLLTQRLEAIADALGVSRERFFACEDRSCETAPAVGTDEQVVALWRRLKHPHDQRDMLDLLRLFVEMKERQRGAP